MKHGAGIYKMAKKLGCKSSEIIDFSSNINSYNPEVNMTFSNDTLVKYADSSYKDLKKIIANKLAIKKSQISLYNGATSAIFGLMRVIQSRDIYLYAPLYGEYEKAAKQEHKNIIKIDRFKDINALLRKNSTVVFVNPSTPDGKYYDLKQLFKIWKKKSCTIILDESFLEFEELKSFRKEIKRYKKLYIIQSFTKFYSCAGVRIGAILSNKKNIQRLQTPLWNLSSLDIEFLSQRLEDKEFEKRSKKRHMENKKKLKKILEASTLFSKIFESDSNFFLTKSDRATEIFKALYKEKILVRTCGSFDFLGDDYLRFGIKDDSLHRELSRALKALI